MPDSGALEASLDNFCDTRIVLSSRGTSGTGQDSQRCVGNSPHVTHDGAAEINWRSSWDCGDIVRRLVARTITQKIRCLVERATSPLKDALSTRAGTESIVHAIQATTDADGRATVLSVDGISACDTTSRVAMFRGLRSMEGGDATPPIRESILWFPFQGEEGEQGDALMPALFSLGQHGALEAIQARLRPSEPLMAFLDNIWYVSFLERTAVRFTAIQEESLIIGIRVHDGKTRKL